MPAGVTAPTPATVARMPAPTRSVGRPRSFDEDEVLDRALEVFWQRGYKGATARLLETELDITQSSIFNAFGTKRELLGLALDRYQQRIDDALVAPLDRPDATLADLDRFFVALLDWITGDQHSGCLLLNLLAETADADPDLVTRATMYRDRVRSAFVAVLLANGNEHTLAGRRAELLVSAAMGLNISARSGAPADELDALTDGIRGEIASW